MPSKPKELSVISDLLDLIDHAAANGFDRHPDTDERVKQARGLLGDRSACPICADTQQPGTYVYVPKRNCPIHGGGLNYMPKPPRQRQPRS